MDRNRYAMRLQRVFVKALAEQNDWFAIRSKIDGQTVSCAAEYQRAALALV
ncbi:MAG TPA: hypothetical protein VLA39_02760 [Marinobacterium sp.]|nr:hypothetical protein [Marinobacterium sp.]